MRLSLHFGAHWRRASEAGRMLAERILAVVPDMPPFVRRWFLEPDHARPSIEHQDWDFIIADWVYLPLLIEYSEDSTNPLEKRFVAL